MNPWSTTGARTFRVRIITKPKKRLGGKTLGELRSASTGPIVCSIARSASAQARRLVRLDEESSLGRTSSIMLLSEMGLHKVSMLTRQPTGDRMRDWLAADVLPQIARAVGHNGSPGRSAPRSGT